MHILRFIEKDLEFTETERESIFHVVNDRYNLFSFNEKYRETAEK
jgi:hypothetical protein